MVKVTDTYGREVSAVGTGHFGGTVKLSITHDGKGMTAHLNLTEVECLITLLKETIKFCKT